MPTKYIIFDLQPDDYVKLFWTRVRMGEMLFGYFSDKDRLDVYRHSCRN